MPASNEHKRPVLKVICHNESGIPDLCGRSLGIREENGEQVLHILIERKSGRRPPVSECKN